MNLDDLKARVSAAFADRDKLKEPFYQMAVKETVALLDRGVIRVAQKGASGWEVNAWVKEAILCFFAASDMRVIETTPFEFHDKIPLKKGLADAGVRVVPPGAVRYGAFCERGVVVMPGYVNIGAWVGAGTMVDTWATVGSCAQIGRNVHLSGGVGIGGVLEPPSATPVIIEDGAFIGSRAVIVEGVQVGEEAVIGANVVLTASTHIIDVTGETEVVSKGRVPPRSIVIPGTRARRFPAGEYQVPCALIIGQRSAATDSKTSLNQVLRDFAVAV
ncbi:MAG: 2,3,4,5-tetrahydropyridine-2,6-dicarboxylate N-succinyltransferase [Myxococcaceae bacterium]|jgi:2,3,4,5-tetrahydropyridine-2-carboxylate N-succinyltransferase|nr:2,3,4,5-tetrahydropyridine-2,6-dicarboxylate N-succinyltransferase [Myxococcaceae bacterium]